MRRHLLLQWLFELMLGIVVVGVVVLQGLEGIALPRVTEEHRRIGQIVRDGRH